MNAFDSFDLITFKIAFNGHFNITFLWSEVPNFVAHLLDKWSEKLHKEMQGVARSRNRKKETVNLPQERLQRCKFKFTLTQLLWARASAHLIYLMAFLNFWSPRLKRNALESNQLVLLQEAPNENCNNMPRKSKIWVNRRST